MLTLSVCGAQAYYIVSGVKKVENRSWRTEHRGPILVHASGDRGMWPDPSHDGRDRLPVGCEYLEMINKPDKQNGDFWIRRGGKIFFRRGPFGPSIEREYRLWDRIFRLDPPSLPTQAIIGRVDLVDIVRDYHDPWADKGVWNWILENPIWFDKPTIGIAGKVKPFNYPCDKLVDNGGYHDI